MNENILIKCPGCGIKNRIPLNRVNDRPKCGRCGVPLSSAGGEPVKFTDADFESLVSSSKAALVDCWAPWCGPCRVIGPVVEELAAKYAGRALIGKLNVDENPVTAQRYQIRSIPTLLFFKNGQLVDTLVGAVPAQQIIQKLETII